MLQHLLELGRPEPQRVPTGRPRFGSFARRRRQHVRLSLPKERHFAALSSEHRRLRNVGKLAVRSLVHRRREELLVQRKALPRRHQMLRILRDGRHLAKHAVVIVEYAANPRLRRIRLPLLLLGDALDRRAPLRGAEVALIDRDQFVMQRWHQVAIVAVSLPVPVAVRVELLALHLNLD